MFDALSLVDRLEGVADLAASASDNELLAILAQVDRVANAAAAARAQVVAVVSQRPSLEMWGHSSVAALLTARLRLAPAEARALASDSIDVAPRRTLTGEVLPATCPGTAAAARAGLINPGHVKAVTTGLRRVEPFAAPDQLADLERVLLDLAAQWPPAVINQAVRAAMDVFNPDGAEPREDQDRRRGLTWKQRLDGLVDLYGTLSPECAAKLAAVLSPLAAPRPADAHGRDLRTPPQRRHDGFEAAMDRLLRSGTLPDHGGVPVTVAVTIDLDQLRQEVGRVTSHHGIDLDVATLLRTAGELAIIPVVLSKADGIVAYGTTRRLASPGQTRALWARDRGCSFPQCDRPPEWSDRHHIIEVVPDNGPTDLDNLTLLCRYHHSHFKQWGWTCRMIHGRPWWIPPAAVDPDRTPQLNTTHVPPRLPCFASSRTG